jgi:hypothetical protein
MADLDENDLLGAAKMNRRGLLKCMAWPGTGVLWTLSGGVPRTLGLIGGAAAAEAPQGALCGWASTRSKPGSKRSLRCCGESSRSDPA